MPSLSGSSTPRDSVADDGDMSSSLSNKLLHVAFASLSLTDKCALSLSIGQLSSGNVPSTPTATLSAASGASASATNSAQRSSNYNSAMNTPRGITDSRSSNSSSGSDVLHAAHSSSSASLQPVHTPSQSLSLEVRMHRVGSMEEDMSEMHSVLSESDKESLDVAMSMMGQTELNQVEDEVRPRDALHVGVAITCVTCICL